MLPKDVEIAIEGRLELGTAVERPTWSWFRARRFVIAQLGEQFRDASCRALVDA
jgi:hypothetical protein